MNDNANSCDAKIQDAENLLRKFRGNFRAWIEDDSQGGCHLQELCAEFVDEINALLPQVQPQEPGESLTSTEIMRRSAQIHSPEDVAAPAHSWQFCMNGTFCTRCGRRVEEGSKPCQ